MVSPYITVAEDIEWLRDEWLDTDKMPSPAELRRGSATLRRLLVDGLVHEAAHFHGWNGSLNISGPDLLQILESKGNKLDRVVNAITGGGVRSGIAMSAMSMCRVDNPVTGVSADAEEGFAVTVNSVSRDARGVAPDDELKFMVEKTWKLGAYLDAPGAIQLGIVIPRAAIIQYSANFAGGVHLDRTGTTKPKKQAQFALIEHLEGSNVFDLNGVHFELFSIGQAVGRANDFQALAAAIRAE